MLRIGQFDFARSHSPKRRIKHICIRQDTTGIHIIRMIYHLTQFFVLWSMVMVEARDAVLSLTYILPESLDWMRSWETSRHPDDRDGSCIVRNHIPIHLSLSPLLWRVSSVQVSRAGAWLVL